MAMESVWQDLRYGIRVLLKKPGFTIVAVLTLALGIGANSAIFSVVNSVLLRPLPVKDPDQLVRIYETFLPSGYGTVSVPNLKDWREQNDLFTQLAAYTYDNFSLMGKDNPERISGAPVSANFFEVLGVPPLIGRTFLEGEDQQGNNRVVVLSYQLWQRNFGGDAGILGRNVPIGGENFTVIGVMPASFRFPFRSTELWVPLVFSPSQVSNRGSHAFFVLGRMKPGVTLDKAKEQMISIARGIEQQFPDQQTGRSVMLVLLQEEIVSNIRPALMVLLGAVGFVLLIACTNVGNLLLARAAGRRKEIAIRTALGAGRWRIIRQLLTESLLLSIAGGVLGLLIAIWGVQLLVALAQNYLPRAHEVGLDWRVVLFTLSVSLLAGIGFGLVPALQVSKIEVQGVLKEGTGGNSPGQNWLRGLLVVAEIGSAMVLLIGAGLMIKSFLHLQQLEPGLNPENVLTLRFSLPEAKYNSTQTVANFHQQILERVSALPGVESAGAINLLPIQDTGFNGGVSLEGQDPFPPGQEPLAEFRSTSPDYFKTFKIPLIAGRFFSSQDQENTEPVTIINQALAKKLLPNEDPIGKRIKSGVSKLATIVGVVGDVKQSGLLRQPMPEIYYPFTQAQTLTLTRNMSLVVRSSSDPDSLVSAIRSEVRAIDPAQPIFNVKKMEEVISGSISYHRLNMILLGGFAAIAMLLAMLGIYSVMSYTVIQNTREIGIRMALGAQRMDVLRLILGHGFILAIIGIGIGLAGAFGLMRLMESLLFGVTATDPLTFILVSLLLLVVSLLACYIPARRAMRVDPMVALRYE
jgi:putative ABC transport system permease protein